MSANDENPPPRRVSLDKGAQAIINGALITACAPCEIEVSAGAFVFTGRALWRDPASVQPPHEALYFGILDASADPETFEKARYRLFALLGQVVMTDRTLRGQRECTLCAAAIKSGEIAEAVECARRLAERSVASDPVPVRVPGRTGTPRQRSSIHSIEASRGSIEPEGHPRRVARG